MAQENIDKVNAIIEEYGYKRNIFASNLAFNKKFKFAVLLPQFSDLEYWKIQMRGIEKAEKEFKPYGVSISYYLYDFDPVSFVRMAQNVLEADFDGLLFAPIFYDESVRFLEEFQKKDKPIVMIDSDIVEPKGHAYVGQNAFKSGFLAGRLTSFAVKEQRKVLIVKITRDIEATSVYLQRIDGFYSFFRQNPQLTHFKFSEITINDSSLNQLDKAMFEGISSVFVPNSRAYIVAQFLEENQINGIRIIGYDLLEKNIEYLKKGVIDFLINQKPEEQGYSAVNHLYKKLVLQEAVEETYYMPLEIIVKENFD
ncbi:transcriptional regulator [Flavobacterium sp. UMI-01]|nr:transcriptional regulator [Flavobacterium sp. UMI-01]